MKKMLALLLMASMLLAATGALAATGDAVLFRSDGGYSQIQTAAAVGDVIYAANWDEMRRIRLGDAEPTQLSFERPENGDINKLFEADGKLYALITTWKAEGEQAGCQLAEVAVDDGAKVSLVSPLTLDWRLMANNQQGMMTEFDCPVIDGGKLYLLTMGDDYLKTRLMAFDLKDGSCEQVAGAQEKDYAVVGIASYKPGQLLAVARHTSSYDAPMKLGTIDLKAGAFTPAFEVDTKATRELYGLAYDRASDGVFYVQNGQIQRLQGLNPATAEAVNDMPMPNNGLMVRAGQALPGNLYMFYSYDALMIRSVDPAQKPTRTLTIRSWGDMNDAYYAFTAAHPETSVVFDNSWSPDTDITQAMMNREDKIDIYQLSADSSAFKALTGRGYVAEVTDEAARAGVARMYPAIQQALSVGGKLIAVPQRANGVGEFCYNKDVLKKLKLTVDDLPKTWSQVIDFIADWGGRYSADYPELMPLDPSQMPNIRQALLQSIIADYMRYMQFNNLQKFDSPVLRKTLQKLDAADFSDIQTKESEDGGYSWDGDTVLFSNYAPVGFNDYGGSNEIYLPISFVEREGVPVAIQMEMFVINPFSKNQDIAQQYLGACVANMSEAMRMTLSPEDNKPIRPLHYEPMMREVQKQLAEAEKQLADAKPEDKPQYQEMIDNYKRNIEENEKNEWAASPEDIERYHKLVDCLIVPMFSLYSGGRDGSESEIMSLISRYNGKQIPLDQFLSGVDQKLRMAMMEGY